MFCYFKVPFYLFAGMITFILLISCVVFFLTSCETNKLSFFDSLYFSSITFFTVGYGDVTLTNIAGKIISMITGGTGVLFMGMFVSSFYASFQNYNDYKLRLPHDKNALRVLSETRQDYLNIFGNYHLTKAGTLNFDWNREELEKIKDDVYASLIRTNTPDLSSEHHAFGILAFLRNAEIVDRKIQNLVIIDFDSNFKSEIKYIALLSRNLVNDFHWNLFKKVDFNQQNRDFIDSVFIVGTDKSSSIVMKFLELEKELGQLTYKMYQVVSDKESTK